MSANTPRRLVVHSSYHLSSGEALDLLRRALEQAEQEASTNATSTAPRLASAIVYPTATVKGEDSSSSDEPDGKERAATVDQSDSSASPSSSDADDDDDEDEPAATANENKNFKDDSSSFAAETELPSEKAPSSSQVSQKPKSRKAPPKHNPTSLDQLIKQLGRPPCLSFPLLASSDSPPPLLLLDVPMSLLNRHHRRQWMDDQPAMMCRSMYQMAQVVQKKPVLVLLLRSGRFAGGVFMGTKCLVHRACQRYTVRRGQGKAQSSQDNSKRKAKSMGAQLRRAGEQNLREDIITTIKEWQKHLNEAALIFLSCPKTMKKNFFEDLDEWLARDDERLRDVPLDVGRPTFESVCAVHQVMLTLLLREAAQHNRHETEQPQAEQTVNGSVDTNVQQQQPKVQNTVKESPKEEIVIPLSPLHLAAQAGDFATILQLLDSESSEEFAMQVDQPAGIEFMTPLHYAAESGSHVDPATAAACVSALLIQGHANPCLVDVRNRPAYFLASHEKVRDAFRNARAKLGEEYCRWDEDAKVGPALTAEDMEARKEKEAEKKRRKKVKQKEKKAKDKTHMEEMENRRREEEERQQKENEAKRIRDGLQPRTSSAGNVCDFCQKVCKGKLRLQMFKRLDYANCSTECVEKHKRELMAAAAMARFGQQATT